VPLASFFILILLFSRIFPQFVGMNTDVNMIMANIPSVRLVIRLDEELPDSGFAGQASENRIELTKEIILDNIEFAYQGGESLFRGYSDTIPAKKITGILGESGIGKTTLIDIIAGLQKTSSGVISVDGRILDDSVLPAWRQSIGYLPQDPFFIDGTLRENLVWDSSNEIVDNEILGVLEQVNAVHLIKRFDKGLDEYIVNYQYTFSGGECQRLALARVLLRRPGLLLLDEATSSLDADNEVVIMDVLTRLKESVTVVFVTHRVGLAGWFDKVINLG
jgi:ATP-binding cassette subfamily C protein